MGGYVVFTLIVPCELMLAFIKERETAQTWTGIVNMLYRTAGPAFFNINSYTRASLGNSTPYDAFVKTYGEDAREFLDRLGVAKIPANEVTLDPYVLGKRFKRHVDRVILRKNGIIK